MVDDDAIGPAQRRERRPVGVWADCDKMHAMQGFASVVPAQADDVGDRDVAGRCEGIGGGTVVGRAVRAGTRPTARSRALHQHGQPRRDRVECVPHRPLDRTHHISIVSPWGGGDVRLDRRQWVGVGVPVEFLTDAQAATYGCYSQPPSPAELDRSFLLDDKARGLIESKRLPHTRLGYALQLSTLMFVGTFLADPTDAPTEVLDYLAEQLDIADPSCVKAYRVREMTRIGHAREIRLAYGFVEFTEMQDELVRWVADRAWTSGDGPKALFDGAVTWLRERRVLLPGVSTLARLVARVRDAAMQRLWDTLSGLLNAQQARALDFLLEVPEGARTSDLERLRRGPTRVSGKAMVAALDRVSEIAGLGVGGIDLGAVPRRRVVELARYGMTGKAPALRRHPYARRLATLLTAVVDLQAKATDDALELFDVLMTNDLLARA